MKASTTVLTLLTYAADPIRAFVPGWKRVGGLAAAKSPPAAFVARRGRAVTHVGVTTSFRLAAAAAEDPLAEFSEERKAELFQFMLRDLQVEEVPLLGVDADQVHTMQAALWTTMAELAEQDGEQKACLIFEDIPIPALKTFVDDFMTLKTQDRLMKELPDLERFSLSLVGKGVGPAILVEAAAPSDRQALAKTQVDLNKATAAMQMFVDRVVVESNVCPYTNNNQMAPTGLDDVGFPASPIGYRVSSYAEVCHILSAFWNTVCEILATPMGQLSTSVLVLPGVDSHARFAAVAELLSRSLCLYNGESVLELLYFHPSYNRNEIHPLDQPAHGHLPPASWLRPMLVLNGNSDDAEKLSDKDLETCNYQRRSPVPAVCIKRVEMLNAATDAASGVMELTMDAKTVVQASGIPTYARNAVSLSKEGADALQEALDVEITIVTA